MVIELIGIGGAGLGLSAYLWRRWSGISICPKCKKRAVWKWMEEDNQISRCANCDWQMYKHGKSVEPDATKNCPSCSGYLVIEGSTWKCIGYPGRASIVAQRGEKMTPKSLQSIPSCKWTGRDEDYGKVWR